MSNLNLTYKNHKMVVWQDFYFIIFLSNSIIVTFNLLLKMSSHFAKVILCAYNNVGLLSYGYWTAAMSLTAYNCYNKPHLRHAR